MGGILKFIFGGEISDTESIARAIGILVADITDVHMWQSLGWITLGVVLMLLGVQLWVSQDAASIAGQFI